MGRSLSAGFGSCAIGMEAGRSSERRLQLLLAICLLRTPRRTPTALAAAQVPHGCELIG